MGAGETARPAAHPRREPKGIAAPTIHLPQPNSPRRGPPQKRRIDGPTPLAHARLRRRLPMPGHEPRRAAAGIQAYPRLRQGIDSQRPTTHRPRRRPPARNGPTGRQLSPSKRREGQRARLSDATASPQSDGDMTNQPPRAATALGAASHVPGSEDRSS